MKLLAAMVRRITAVKSRC